MEKEINELLQSSKNIDKQVNGPIQSIKNMEQQIKRPTDGFKNIDKQVNRPIKRSKNTLIIITIIIITAIITGSGVYYWQQSSVENFNSNLEIENNNLKKDISQNQLDISDLKSQIKESELEKINLRNQIRDLKSEVDRLLKTLKEYQIAQEYASNKINSDIYKKISNCPENYDFVCIDGSTEIGCERECKPNGELQ